MNAERFSVFALSLLLVWMVALLVVACAFCRGGAKDKREGKRAPRFLREVDEEEEAEKKNAHTLFFPHRPPRKTSLPTHQQQLRVSRRSRGMPRSLGFDEREKRERRRQRREKREDGRKERTFLRL